jgi:hypothetical protein
MFHSIIAPSADKSQFFGMISAKKSTLRSLLDQRRKIALGERLIILEGN